MPERRYERREPTQDWQQIQPLLKDTAQFNYEVIRPVILWGQTPQERGGGNRRFTAHDLLSHQPLRRVWNGFIGASKTSASPLWSSGTEALIWPATAQNTGAVPH